MHKETCELHPKTIELIEQIAKLVEKGGIEIWQNLDVQDLLGIDTENYIKCQYY